MVDVPESTEENGRVVFIEQYVQDVVGFSSQYGSDGSISYTAYNIIGKPSKFPEYGDFPQACVMRTYGKWWNESPSRTITIMPQSIGKYDVQDFLDVEFEQYVYPFRVSVYETYNPGSVVRIWAADPFERWKLLWEGEPQIVGHVPRMFTPVLKPVNFLTRTLRLEFHHYHLEYYTQLDAVLLVGTKQPIVNNEQYCKAKQNSAGKLTSQILEMNIHNIPPQVDIPHAITNFLGEDFPQYLLNSMDIETTSSSTKEGLAVAGRSFECLPDETILKIFGYLDLLSLCRCAQVNKHFSDLATDPLLYTELNLKVYFYCISPAALHSLAPRCQYLQKLDMSWCGGTGVITAFDFVNFIKEHGGQLTHLRLNSCSFVDDSCIKNIGLICQNLKELSLRNCTNITFEFISLARLGCLQYLDLYRTFISLGPLQEILKSLPHLKHINLGSCVRVSNMDDVALTMANYNPELVSADFWKTYSLTPIGVKALALCQYLEEIDLGWCLGFTVPGNSLLSLARGCPRLKKLFLAAIRGITDRDLEPFIELCPDIEQVDLLGIRSISSDICSRFLKCCRKLKFLDISFCDQILDCQVVHWRHMYPEVSIKRSFQRSGEVWRLSNLH